jgi:hypothetical protein
MATPRLAYALGVDEELLGVLDAEVLGPAVLPVVLLVVLGL